MFQRHPSRRNTINSAQVLRALYWLYRDDGRYVEAQLLRRFISHRIFNQRALKNRERNYKERDGARQPDGQLRNRRLVGRFVSQTRASNERGQTQLTPSVSDRHDVAPSLSRRLESAALGRRYKFYGRRSLPSRRRETCARFIHSYLYDSRLHSLRSFRRFERLPCALRSIRQRIGLIGDAKSSRRIAFLYCLQAQVYSISHSKHGTLT